MFFKNSKLVMILMVTSLLLVACGGSIEKDIIGSWKGINNDEEVETYLEFDEERVVIREMSDDNPESVEYILTETQDDHFILEVINPASGSEEFLFEGYFENKDTIKPIENSDVDFELIRVDYIEEDMTEEKEKIAKAETEREEKEKAKREEKEKAKAERAETEAKVKAEREERAEAKDEEEYESDFNKEIEPDNDKSIMDNVEGETFNFGDKIKVGPGVVQVIGLESVDKRGKGTPASGDKYVLVNVVLENKGEEEFHFNPLDFNLKDSTGDESDRATTYGSVDTDFSNGQLKPGDKTEGILAFSVPEDDKDSDLTLSYLAPYTGYTSNEQEEVLINLSE